MFTMLGMFVCMRLTTFSAGLRLGLADAKITQVDLCTLFRHHGLDTVTPLQLLLQRFDGVRLAMDECYARMFVEMAIPAQQCTLVSVGRKAANGVDLGGNTYLLPP